ncbi:hypothetical protein BGZ60DRAFT_226883 [Tricladium varicosporioides]|nr:hypothetical protein BGZ60DRAFT_226883 [Hymenoscyphus varicosporioides]
MPHITTAMQWSRRRGVGDIILDSLLGRRDVVAQASSVANSFSSWDNCMKAAYCKWPIIAAMVIGGLIVISIVACIVRCACLGYSCCCSCFSCLNCCCGSCCDGKKNKPHKHLDKDPFSPGPMPPNQGYQAPPPMMGGALPAKAEPPQFAQFEVGKNGLYVEPKPTLSEDALPPMPSWEGAAKKHVVDEEKNGVELGNLDPATGQSVPLMTGAVGPATTGPPSPAISPYGAQPGQGIGNNGYIGVANDYSPQPPQNGFAAVGNGPYRGSPSPGPGRGGPPRGGYGGPGQDRNGPGGRGYGPPQDMNNLRGYTASPAQMDPQQMNRGGRGYGPPQDPYGSNEFVGGAVGGQGYGRPPPQRQYSNNSPRPYPQPPSQQYSDDAARALNPGRQQYQDRPYNDYPSNNPPPRGPSRGPSRGPEAPNRMVSPGPINNAGFDFGTGGEQPYTRPTPPPQQNYNSRPPPNRQGSRDNYGNPGPRQPPMRQGSRDNYNNSPSRTPAPQEPAAYPGYKPYQAPNQGGRGGGPPSSLQPGGGRGREPQQGWDPVY